METLTDLMCFSRLGESIPVAAYRGDEWDDKMTGAEGSQTCGKKGEGEIEKGTGSALKPDRSGISKDKPF